MRFLLDSTLLIDHANADVGAAEVLERLFGEGHDLYTCDVVTAETLSRGDPAQLRHLTVLLDALDYVATSPTAARWAASSRRERHLAGGRRALADALIAGVAADLGATIVSRDRPAFDRQGATVLTY